MQPISIFRYIFPYPFIILSYPTMDIYMYLTMIPSLCNIDDDYYVIVSCLLSFSEFRFTTTVIIICSTMCFTSQSYIFLIIFHFWIFSSMHVNFYPVAKETEFEFWGFVFVMLAAVMSGFRWSMTQILLQV